jgi:hypothetical protein
MTSRVSKPDCHDGKPATNYLRATTQAGNNLVRDESGELLVDCPSILIRWKNYFTQLLNLHNVSDVIGQVEVSTA